MSSTDLTSALFKVGIGVMGTFTASLPSFSPEITTPYIGVPLQRCHRVHRGRVFVVQLRRQGGTA